MLIYRNCIFIYIYNVYRYQVISKRDGVFPSISRCPTVLDAHPRGAEVKKEYVMLPVTYSEHLRLCYEKSQAEK